MKKFSANSVERFTLTVLLSACYLFLYLDLSHYAFEAYSQWKYVLILFFAVFLFLRRRRGGGDEFSFVGLIWFVFFTTIYTIANKFEAKSAAILLGYYVAIILYLGSCGADVRNLESATEMSLYIFGLFFAVHSLIEISNPESYSIAKNQFQGAMSNPNSFAGMSGLFALFYLLNKNSSMKAKFINHGLTGVYALFLLMAMSRGAILSLLLVYMIYSIRRFNKYTILSAVLFFVIIFYSYSGLVDAFQFADRDLMEDTGRGEILERYLSAYAKNYLLGGTGVSIESGRIKSELSYLDILLFSGIGAAGFFLFLARSLYTVFRRDSIKWGWPEGIFLYIIIISLFEGYAANVASVPSLLLYIIPGLLFARGHKLQSIRPR